jgi:membrane protein
LESPRNPARWDTISILMLRADFRYVSRGADRLYQLSKSSLVEWFNDNTFRLSASLAFYTIFSLAPVLIIVTGIAGTVFDPDVATAHMVEQIELLVGADGGIVARQVIEGAASLEGGALALVMGVVTLVVGSTAVFAELQSALNLIWNVQPEAEGSAIRNLLRVRLRSFALVLAVGFLLLVSLVLSALLAGAERFLDRVLPGMPWLWHGVNVIASFFLVALLFAMIYKYLPDVRITWRDVAVGAFVTAGLFGVGKSLIGLYLGRAALGSAYGAAGSFVVFLIWIYYSALICFYGAEFTRVYAQRYGSRLEPAAHAEFIEDPA